MALIHLDFHSDILGMAVNADVILPQKSSSLIGMKTEKADITDTLYLLHGLSDDQTIWQRRTSIERYASEKGIAVVMPSADKSWYCDMKYGGAYFTYITEELPTVICSFFKGLSDEREHNFIAGLSMGGYGALKAAITYPERYKAAASFSGAVDIAAYVEGRCEENEPYWYSVLGDFSKVRGSKNDLFALAEKAKDCNPKPDLYMWCGTEDHLISANRRLKEVLISSGFKLDYSESCGSHAWEYWDREVKNALDFFFKVD